MSGVVRDPIAQQLLRAAESKAPRVRVGVVSVVSPLTVTIATADVAVSGRLASYSPVAGHVVLLLQDDDDLVVLGRILGG